MSRFKLERFCLCGGELIAESSDLAAIVPLDEQFNRTHSGAGHGPVTRRQAARVRRRRLIEDAEERGRG